MRYEGPQHSSGSLALVVGMAVGAGPTGAAFPAANGKIAFDSNRDGNFEIYVMDADGSDQTRLTNNPAVDDNPDWQPLSLGGVGGIAELPEVAAAPLGTSDPSDGAPGLLLAVVLAAAAGIAATSAATWCVRSRLGRLGTDVAACLWYAWEGQSLSVDSRVYDVPVPAGTYCTGGAS